MNFKEQIEDDLDVFFNPEEFGSSFDWEGIDIDGFHEEISEQESSKRFGTSEISRRVEIPVSYLTERPYEDAWYKLNGERYRVHKFKEDAGVYYITLYRKTI